MFRIILLLALVWVGQGACAMPLSREACEILLNRAEQVPDQQIYEDCGFGNEQEAWNQWAPFASAHNMKRALFELCRRYPQHQYGPLYCEKAIQLNFGPAFMRRGFLKLEAGETVAALEDFKLAMKTADLSQEEKQKLTEKMALLYITPDQPAYQPREGMPLLKKAAEERSAVANNILAYLTYTGQEGLKVDSQKTLDYLWRSILLGCPAAEENLGAFHLAKQRKISVQDAAYYMSLQAFSCTPFDKSIAVVPKPDPACSCQDIINQEKFLRGQPYLFLDMQEDGLVVIQDKKGAQIVAAKGETLPDGSVIDEVKMNLLTLRQKGRRIPINRYHSGPCVDQCLQVIRDLKKKRPVNIRPYRLRFTDAECDNIDYYAKRLVDKNLPYTGKKECQGKVIDKTPVKAIRKNKR